VTSAHRPEGETKRFLPLADFVALSTAPIFRPFLSTPLSILIPMSRPSFEELCTEASELEIYVRETKLPAGTEGYWDPSQRTIWLKKGLPTHNSACTLAHELEHARRGDNGRQDEYVESFIDEKVALRFINPTTYARLEEVYGCEPGVIAEELDLPRWVIEAWQRLLNRAERVG
jgi:hypothetical protein